jgi:two-component system cell cycle sensor histidine kinase/response regulator CckA
VDLPGRTDVGSGNGWRGQGTVLIVDDEETVRSIASQMVEVWGFKAVTADHGREGLEKYKALRPEIAVVLLDLTMPHLDGEQVLHELRRIDPKVSVILMSGFSEQEAIGRFTGKGLAGFIQKSFKLEELKKALMGALSK